jgi:hypothetical protein
MGNPVSEYEPSVEEINYCTNKEENPKIVAHFPKMLLTEKRNHRKTERERGVRVEVAVSGQHCPGNGWRVA